MREFKATETKPLRHSLVIQEVYATEKTGAPVFVPHEWLFKEKVYFAIGKIGDVQRKMLTYIKTILMEEIDVEKEVRQACHNAQQKGKPSGNPATTPVADPVASMATVDHEHEQQELAEA
jgi:hypothetical protein